MKTTLRLILVTATVALMGTAILSPALGAEERRVPTVDELITLRSAGSPRISPDGGWVVYTVSGADLEKDTTTTHLWLAEVPTGRTFQLTRGEKSCSNPEWSPDGRWIAFTSSRAGDKSQIFLIDPGGGEAVQLTDGENGAGGAGWSPDGSVIAYTADDPTPKALKDRKEKFGDFFLVRREYTHRHLWTVDVAEALTKPQAGKRRTEGTDFTVGSFAWSPDGKRIAFSATVNPDLINGGSSDIYVLDLADDSVRKVVDQPGPDSSPQWSPDGSRILFSSAKGDPHYYASNSELALVPVDGGAVRYLTEAFDENPRFVAWTKDGIYFNASQKTAAHLFRLDPANLGIVRVTSPDAFVGYGFSFSRDGKTVAFTSASPTSLTEVCVSSLPFSPKKLTDMTAQVRDFVMGTREVVSWKSKDGTEIEGILVKPAGFDPARKYALLCVIHGGPTGVDRPLLGADTRYYPSDIWAARGALVLKVNYRGSAGYGEAFRKLNMRNLGVGDAWDVLSGVDFLVGKGWVDPARVGCMGWSQGGYISAFLTTSSDRFKAISVGAGISNWATYYYNTDITPFTINYLGDDPVDDPEIYAKTSPMTYIKGAKTPTLIQHGEFDRRVPIPNAYELRQGLEDRGVPVEMVVYKGFGHGITKPKSMRAVMRHNLAWFGHHIFGDPAPDLALLEK